MKACFIGAGSIGRRHIRNFYQICLEKHIFPEIHIYRSTNSIIPEDILSLITKQLFSYDAIDDWYDVVFITNPTYLHYITIKNFAKKSKHFFIEKPLFETSLIDVKSLSLSEDVVCYVACPLRYSSTIITLKALIPQLSIYSVRAISSSYLPDWRPGIDYRNIYSSNAENGGGVCLDLIHEWDYLTDLFGFPEKTFSLCSKLSHLEIDSEDLAVYIAKYPDKVIELHLDYFGRISKRQVEIFTKEESWLFNILDGNVWRNNDLFTECREDLNQKYLREMNYFIELFLKGEKNNNDLNNALKVIALAELPKLTTL